MQCARRCVVDEKNVVQLVGVAGAYADSVSAERANRGGSAAILYTKHHYVQQCDNRRPTCSFRMYWCLWRSGSLGQVENMLSRASRSGQFETLVYHSAIDPKKVRQAISCKVYPAVYVILFLLSKSGRWRGGQTPRSKVELGSEDGEIAR